MTEAQIKTYLKGVFDIEMHKYVLEETIESLSGKQQMLGRRKAVAHPAKCGGDVSFLGTIWVTGFVCGILGAIYILIDLCTSSDDNGLILDIIIGIVAVPVSAIFFAIIFGLPIGTVVWLIRFIRERAQIKRKYERDVEKYELAVDQENARLRREERQKAALAAEIDSLQKQLAQTKRNLNQLYGYGILARDYRHLYAVGVIYNYFCTGRTHSLQFDTRTGDQGAYNLYESERRLDRIITNTEEILYRLDEIAQYQRDLRDSMQNATRQISTLCNKVTAQLSTISDSVAATERNTSIIAYNTACIESETRFMAWMDAAYRL